MKNSQESMSIDTFEKIITKAKEEEYRHIGLFNWIEPFLSKELDIFVSLTSNHGLQARLSSNLSLPPENYKKHISSVLKRDVNNLIVSISGFEQKIYEINHRGGNISWVKQNLEHIADLKQKGEIKTNITLRFLEFSYNNTEKTKLKDYAESLGLNFETLKGVGSPDRPIDTYQSEDTFIDRLKNYRPDRLYEQNGEICPLIADTLAINCKGEVYICCAYPYYDSLRIGSFLEMSEHEILLQRYNHPICNSCRRQRRKMTEFDAKSLIGAVEYRLAI